MRLAGKKAMVTGAARGIGLGCAKMMADHGARVVIADIDMDAARAAARSIDGAIAVELDVTSRDNWVDAVTEADNLLGGLNVLVNNAGIIIPGSVESLDEESWDKTMDVDLKSVFLGCQVALPVMARSAPASIINIASIASIIASAHFSAYNAAKAGVHMLTKSVALHAARKHAGVRCNSIHPAFVDTAMIEDVVRNSTPQEARAKLAAQIPMGRIATVEDVAWAVVYLSSDESAFMTGSEIKLDGGISAM
jgi:NAD(P)-dependent dehydrogenase (short-subunit alcohol dehydrogenase family)